MSEEEKEVSIADAIRLAGAEVIERIAKDDQEFENKRAERIAKEDAAFRLKMLEINTVNRDVYEHERITRLRALFDRETLRMRAKLDGKALDERDADIEAVLRERLDAP